MQSLGLDKVLEIFGLARGMEGPFSRAHEEIILHMVTSLAAMMQDVKWAVAEVSVYLDLERQVPTSS